MFSTMTTVPSMMMPKSMAPMESRLAAPSWACRTMKANSRESGMVRATIIAARKLTRKKIRTISTRTMPRRRLSSTVSVVNFTSSLRS